VEESGSPPAPAGKDALRPQVRIKCRLMKYNSEEAAEIIEAVEQANKSFYRALENADLEAMSSVWLHDSWVKCVHPGWDLIIGWEKVRESWRQIFGGNVGMRVAATDVEIEVKGDFALVSCYEMLAVFLDSNKAPVSARTTATNLFQLVAGQWRMIHHHASQVLNAPLVNESEDFSAGSGSNLI
jgi:ketosteroid isomerase-like protein